MYIKNDDFILFVENRLIFSLNQCNNTEIDELIKKYDSGRKINDIMFPYFESNMSENISLEKMLPYCCGLNLTNLCQLRCNYCSYCSGEHSFDTAKIENICAFLKFIIDNFIYRKKLNISANNPTIYFAGGGEPTYNWKLLEESVEYIKKYTLQNKVKYRLGITTNGLLEKRQIDYIIENFDTILVSYDGTKEIQNKNRKSISFKNSAKIVESTIKYLDEKKCSYSIRTTIWPEDYIFMRDMADNIYNRYPNITSWSIEPVLQLGRAKRNDIFNIENKDNIMSVDFVSKYVDLRVYVGEKYKKYVHTAMIKNEFACYNCATAFGQFPWLNANGDIYACLDSIGQTERIGYISDSKMTFISYNDDLNLSHIENMRKMCVGCIAFPFCGGGCPLKHQLNEFGERINITSTWDCSQKKKYWQDTYHKLLKYKKTKDFKLKEYDKYNGQTVYQIIKNDEV